MLFVLLLLQLSLWILRSAAIPVYFNQPQANSIFVSGALIYVDANIPTDNLATFTLTNGAGYSVSQVGTYSFAKTIGPSQTVTFIAPLGYTGVFLITADFIDNGDETQQYSITIYITANTPAFGPGGFASGNRRRPRRYSLNDNDVQVSDFEESLYQDADHLELEAFVKQDAVSAEPEARS